MRGYAERLKIIFTKKLYAPFGSKKVDWTRDEKGIAFCGLFWAPSPEELRQRHWSIDPEILGAMFEEFPVDLIPREATVYARIFPFYTGGEFEHILQDVRSQGRTYTMDRMPPEPTANWKKKLASRLRPIRPQRVSVVADASYVSHCFKNYLGWTNGPYTFLVCKSPLDGWATHLKSTDRQGITKSLLEKTELVFVNHDEHGLEIMSCVREPDSMLDAVRNLASKVAIPVEIQETGNPWGDVGPFGYHVHQSYKGPSMMRPKPVP